MRESFTVPVMRSQGIHKRSICLDVEVALVQQKNYRGKREFVDYVFVVEIG